MLLLISVGAGAFFYLDEGTDFLSLRKLLKGDHEALEAALAPLKTGCKNGETGKCKLLEKAEAQPGTVASATAVLLDSCLAGTTLDATDCAVAGRLLPASSVPTYASRCRDDNPKYCIIVASSIGVNPQLNQADIGQYLQLGCERGLWSACTIWSSILSADELKFLTSGCSEKKAVDCFVLGAHSDFVKQAEEAKRYFEQSCTLGDFWGCGFYGLHMDSEAEIESLKPSCTPETPQNCFKISGYYFFKKKDFEKSKQFNGIACNGKSLSFCEKLKGFY